MKASLLILAATLAGMPAVALAQQKTELPFVKAATVKIATPWNLPPTLRNYTVDRFGGMSSLPWTRITGREMRTVPFADTDTPKPKFRLLSIGAEPTP